MDTSVSDVSISDFAECRKVTRKRKRKIAPLKFEESPLDATFYSPDRPRAAYNPKGAPAVDVGQTNSWISLDEFGKLPSSRPTLRRRPRLTRGQGDIITCSRCDCANPRHVHPPGPVTKQINISDNDSDLLISVENVSEHEKSDVAKSKGSNSGKALNNSLEVENNVANTSKVSGESDSGIGNSDNKHSDLSIDHVTCNTPDHVTCNTPDHVTSNIPDHVTCHSPTLQRIGFSQCKSGQTKKRTRQRLHPHSNDIDTFPVPVFISNQHPDKENLRRRVVFESPRTPATSAIKLGPRLLETPESVGGKILVEDTPEHLVGVRMVTRRLRRLLGHTVPDSLTF